MRTIKHGKRVVLSAVASGLILLSACKKEDDKKTTSTNNNSTFTLNISGLEDLGSGYTYEGWLIVNGSPVSAGTFNVDASGKLSKTSFEATTSNLSSATAYVLTIEPVPDNDPAPSAVHILAGDFSGNTSSLTVSHASAIGTDFTSATGTYILATPTDGGAMSNEESGVWWLDPAGGPGAGLSIPTLPGGWKYEGWAVINGTPISTGTFSMASGSDDNAPFSGSTAGPMFPGEDFLMNAPSGTTFPTDLRGQTVVISVEPVPDNSAAQFLLKPLVGNVPAMAGTHSALMMMNNATQTNPTGTVTR